MRDRDLADFVQDFVGGYEVVVEFGVDVGRGISIFQFVLLLVDPLFLFRGEALACVLVAVLREVMVSEIVCCT